MKKSTTLFFIFIFGLFICNLVTKDVAFSELENTYLSMFPSFSTEAVLNGEYMADVEDYVEDQFSFRDFWLKLKSSTELILGKTNASGIVICEDGQLVQENIQYSQESIDKKLKYLSNFTNKYKTTVLLIPTAAAFAELPNHYEAFDEKSFIQEVRDTLVNADVLDTFGALDGKENMYYHTDHHYTSFGAMEIASLYLEHNGHFPIHKELEQVSDSFYGTLYSKFPTFHAEPDEIYAYNSGNYYSVSYDNEKPVDSMYSAEYLNKKDKYGYFLDGNHAIVKIKTENENGKKLLVLRDSYANEFIPFIADSYEEVHVLDMRYLNLIVSNYMQTQGITDVVILYNVNNFITDNYIQNII